MEGKVESKSPAVNIHIDACCSEQASTPLPTVLLPALSDLTADRTDEWNQFEQILNPKPIASIVLPEDYCCPITSRLLREPVTTSDGHTYEREAIEKWLEDHNTSPLAGAEPLKNKQLTPVLFVKNAVGKLLDRHPELRDSKEWYLPESWVKELGRACELGDEAAIRELVGRDRRLLVHTFDDTCGVQLGGKTALQFAVTASTHNNNKTLLVVVELLERRKRGLGLAALLQEYSKRKGHVALHQAILAGCDCGILLQIMTWMGKSLDLVSAPPDWPLLENDQGGVESKSELSIPALTQIRYTLNALLLWSVVRGDPVKVACLLRLRASPDVLNGEGKSMLYVAVMQACNLEIEVPAQADEEATKAKGGHQRTLLMRGQVIRLLLQEGANPNALNADGEHAPLHLALEKDLLAVALELVNTGHASLDLRLVDGTSPLHVVAGKATTELADALWGGDNGAIVAAKSPKQHLSSSNELETMRGAEAHTPLHCAAKSGSSAMLHWLANRGAQLMAVNAKQQNILHLAASNNRTRFAAEAVRLLEAAGHTQQALSSSVDCDGNTPLHLAAAQSGASDMVRWLLAELGALPPSRNRAGQLPRQVAESLGHMAVLQAYDDTVAMLRAKDEAVLAQQQGPLGQLLLKQQRVIETQQARLEQQEDVIARQQEKMKQQELQLKGIEEKFLAFKVLLKPLLDEQMRLETETFLKHVVCGDSKMVEAMITQNRDVLLRKGNVTDLSRRTFYGITGFQYAAWALDWRMYRMMLKQMSKEEARVQHAELDARVEHGNQFDHQALINAYRALKYLASARWVPSADFNERYLRHLVSAQRLLPVHVLQELAEMPLDNYIYFLCSKDGPFTTEHSFQMWYETVSSNTMWMRREDGKLCEVDSLLPAHLSLITRDHDSIDSIFRVRKSSFAVARAAILRDS